ncbi:MAG: NADH-quinone oxidoreductase subunit L [Thermoprotei archaeon]|nr:MAG: NADH-quinone oxidoreductase subunit L [Thermoprotei archaeon]
MSVEVFANLAWGAPVAGALLTPLLARISGKVRDSAAVAACLASALSASMLLAPLIRGELPTVYKHEWVGLPGLGKISFGILLDPLSVILANMVAWISTLVFIYSLSYMRGDPGLTRYWFFMQLFVGNMELLVLSENLVQMLVGWEGVGLCSYALIGYWYQDREEDYLRCWVGEPPEAYPPSHCGLKAFLVTRFGDTLMIAGILLLSLTAGTVSLTALRAAPPTAPPQLLLAALMLIYAGAVGKSAQLPLMEWLPDAMAGPSSVSALIHAATMVKAGAYLTARLAGVALAWSSYVDTSLFFEYVMWTGVITALIASLQAAVATELKKTLAYSTVSQIGYMMAALGATAAEPAASVAAAVFHLLSHAVFKASLFLAAGAVIHAVGSRFYKHYGGLGRYMRATLVSVLLASLSLMGVPPLSGFWSKDLVLSVVLRADPAAFCVALATAGITAFYTVRMVGRTFLGEESEVVREKAEAHEIHEADPVMLAPYAVLAVLSLALGLAGPWLEHELSSALSLSGGAGDPSWEVTAASIIVLLAGVAPAYLLYVKGREAPSLKILERLRELLLRRLYINAAYYKLFALPTLKLGRGALRVEAGMTSTLWRVAVGSLKLADAVRRLHTGVLNWNVLLWVVGGVVLLLLALFG